MPTLSRLIVFGLFFYFYQGVTQSRLNPEAHTHGVATMTIVYQAKQLLVELETPAANMLDFEHSPQNEEQWQRLNQLEKSVSSPENIFSLQPACKLQSVEFELPFQDATESKHTVKKSVELAKNNHNEHKHHEESEHHSEDAHVEHDETPHETHQDIHLAYAWTCSRELPPTIKLQLFSLYPNFETINVQWVANGKQGAKTLNKNHATLDLQL